MESISATGSSVQFSQRFSGLLISVGQKNVTLYDSKNFKNTREYLKNQMSEKTNKKFINWKACQVGFKPAELKSLDRNWLTLGDSFIVKILSEKLRVIKHLDNPKKFPQPKELRELICKAIKGIFDRETSKKVRDIISNGKIRSGFDKITETKYIGFDL